MRKEAAALVLLLGASAVMADVPPGPRPLRPLSAPQPPAPATRCRVVLVPGTADKQARLRLPRSLMKDLRAQAAPSGETRWYAFTGPPRTSTIVAGVALSLSVVLAGLWLTRSRGRRLAGAAASLLLAGVVLGLAGCPSDRVIVGPPIVEDLPPLVRGQDGTLAGEALLEVGEKDDAVELVVDRDDLTTFLNAAAKAGNRAPAARP